MTSNLIRTVLLAHELSREVYENSTTKFHVFGEVAGGVYEINVAKGRKKFARTDSYWGVRRSGKGWKSWQCWIASEDEAVTFARGKLETLRKWAADLAQEAA